MYKLDHKKLLTMTGNQYATWDDAISFMPNLIGNETAENQFNFFAKNISVFVNPNVVWQYTNIISLLYCLHFMAMFYAGSSKPIFDPSVYVANTGAVKSLLAEKVALQYGGKEKDTGLQSDLAQTVFGQTALDFTIMASYVFGIDGQGSLYQSM